MENKSFLKRFYGHLHTINRHKRLVTKLCIKCGLISQGLKHDLSKYSFVEFFAGVKYFQGYRSPIDAEKEDKGYSLGWLHHKGRNKHHWEYWIDRKKDIPGLIVQHIPFNYLLESTIDRIAASKIYNPNYNQNSPLEFLNKGKDKNYMGIDNKERYQKLLEYLSENGEEKTFAYYKELYKKWKKDHSFDI